MYKIYLKEEDLLKDTDFPIIAHLNEASNSDFILFLQNLNNGTGSGYEFTCSNFWDDLDEYDKSQIKKFGIRSYNLNLTYYNSKAFLQEVFPFFFRQECLDCLKQPY